MNSYVCNKRKDDAKSFQETRFGLLFYPLTQITTPITTKPMPSQASIEE